VRIPAGALVISFEKPARLLHASSPFDTFAIVLVVLAQEKTAFDSGRLLLEVFHETPPAFERGWVPKGRSVGGGVGGLQ